MQSKTQQVTAGIRPPMLLKSHLLLAWYAKVWSAWQERCAGRFQRRHREAAPWSYIRTKQMAACEGLPAAHPIPTVCAVEPEHSLQTCLHAIKSQQASASMTPLMLLASPLLHVWNPMLKSASA